jgi:hypothetical protein
MYQITAGVIVKTAQIDATTIEYPSINGPSSWLYPLASHFGLPISVGLF